ncbi:pseudouridine synthase [Corticibacter populi]|uniref:pseudouridine synthase n=1 Tax=Corticibacter populi TaxID=1550736 RepID=UPI001FD238E6|nr:pseudouridine synthase [Corticibacter populi]
MATRWQRPPDWSRVGVPAAAHGTALDFLAARFAHIARTDWQERIARRQVRGPDGEPLAAGAPVAGLGHLYYQRWLSDETPIPFEARVLHRDEHIVVADKPHFLPVAPAGLYLEQTLLRRLQHALGLPQLAPLHRLDKDTAGLVLLSANPATSNAYHRLFREQQVHKEYEAVAAHDARFEQPYWHRSRMEEGGPRFFTMCEVPGEPNSATLLQIAERAGPWARYRLQPVSGKKHQLRLHMAALGVPIRHDPFYPEINDPPSGDYSRPLQLLARRLRFRDPVSGAERVFESTRALQWPVDPADRFE